MTSNIYKLYDNVIQASENLNVRDKSVKVIQYGARLLLGYHSALSLSNDTLAIAKGVSVTGSNARKFFRLLKSVKSIKIVSEALQKLIASPHYDYQTLLQFLQQFCWSIFFYYDNLLLLSRLNVISFSTTQQLEQRSFQWWLAADFINLVSRIRNFYVSVDGYVKAAQRNKPMPVLTNASNNRDLNRLGGASSAYGLNASAENELFQAAHKRLLGDTWFLVKGIVDIIVSGGLNGDVARRFKQITGTQNVSWLSTDGNIGLFGVISAVMNIWEEYKHIENRIS